MNVAILFERSATDEMGIRLTAKELGINLQYLPFRKISVCLENGDYSIRSRVKDYTRVFEDVDVVLNRAQSKNRRILAANILETLGKPVINPSQVEFICFSKLRTILHFWEGKVETPKTVYIPCDPQERMVNGGRIYNEEEIADLIQQKLGSIDVVVKPDAGTHGKNIHLAENREKLLAILRKIRPSITNPIGVFAQEFVPKWFYDLRIVVSKESRKSPFCYSRAMARAGFKDFRTNTYLGNMVFGVTLSSHIRKKAVKCAEAIGRDSEAWVLALDAMVDIGEDKIVDDEYVQSEFQKLTPHFNAVKKVEDKEKNGSNFSDWNETLESAFQNYVNSDPYQNVKRVIAESIKNGEDSILFHEANSCPDFWERTRLVTGINLAIPLLRCAESIVEPDRSFNQLS